jgi:endonuclease YncB( thermonuclease family)
MLLKLSRSAKIKVANHIAAVLPRQRHLRVLIGSGPVRCEGETYDRYKRLIAVCYSGTINLNAELVRLGWAMAYRRYSKDYISVEKEAQTAKRGMWAGEFEPPWKWRRK